MIVISLMMISVCVLAFAAMGGGVMIGVSGVLFLSLALTNRNRTVVTLHDDHLEMKAAPLGSRIFFQYSEISEIEERSPTKVFVHLDSKRYRLPLAILGTEDQALLLETLRTYRNARATRAWQNASSSAW